MFLGDFKTRNLFPRCPAFSYLWCMLWWCIWWMLGLSLEMFCDPEWAQLNCLNVVFGRLLRALNSGIKPLPLLPATRVAIVEQFSVVAAPEWL